MTIASGLGRGPIIAGCDGRAESADAVVIAGLIATALDAELVVAAAWEGRSGEPEAQGRRFFERCFSQAEKALAEKPFRRRELSMSAVQGLQELAGAEGAAMVVVGSTDRGPLGRVIPGSTAEQLIHGAGTPVLLAPRGFAHHGSLTKIGVAFDGLSESELAVDYGWRLAGRLDATLEVLVVGPRYSALDQALTQDRDKSGEALRDRVEAALRMVPDEIQARGRTLTGDPGSELVQASSDLDLLITGSKGKGAISSLALGSVSRDLIRSARCAVLVVPAG